MITILLILTILNTVGLAVILISKFKEKFVIVDLDTYNLLMEFWGEYHDEEGNVIGQELAGGCGIAVGFGAEYLEDDYPDEEEEKKEQKKEEKKKKK